MDIIFCGNFFPTDNEEVSLKSATLDMFCEELKEKEEVIIMDIK